MEPKGSPSNGYADSDESDLLEKEQQLIKDFNEERAQGDHKTKLTYRKLEIGDYDLGYYDVLSNLTETGDVSKEQFEKRFNIIDPQHSSTYKIIVGVDQDNGNIVVNGTLVVEKKFIRGCSQCGHIEDIVVHKDYGKQGIGKEVVDLLKKMARINLCYKTTLD